MHVLVVDDLKEDRYIIKKLLTPHYNVTTLSSATEAVAFALSHSFDVAVVNAMLREDLDGIDLLRSLKTIRQHDFLALACTCHPESTRTEKLLQAGFKDILFKPFDLQVFNKIITSPTPPSPANLPNLPLPPQNTSSRYRTRGTGMSPVTR